MLYQTANAQGSFTGVEVQGWFGEGGDEIFIIEQWRVSGEISDGLGSEL